MWNMNVKSSILTVRLSAYFLPNLVIFIGAKAVMARPTPEMMAYGIAKASVINIALNLTAYFIETHESTRVISILPEVLDTPANRRNMKESSDFSSWTSLDFICNLIKSWLFEENEKKLTPNRLPASGTEFLIKTRLNQTTITTKPYNF